MEQFNQKNYWTWRKILVGLGVIFILFIIYFASRESTNLPEHIKKYPKETKLLEDKVREAVSSMDQDDINLMKELTQKAINLLPDDEKQRLIALQVRFNEYGYASLTENEINIMQQLNQKAFNLLPEEDRLKLSKIFEKAGDNIDKNIKQQFPNQSKSRLKELVDKLDDPSDAVRWQAIVELEKLGPKAKEIIPDLIRYLENDDWRIRYYTVEILGMIGPDAKAAVPALQKVSKDPDRKVRKRASWALDEISKNNTGR